MRRNPPFTLVTCPLLSCPSWRSMGACGAADVSASVKLPVFGLLCVSLPFDHIVAAVLAISGSRHPTLLNLLRAPWRHPGEVCRVTTVPKFDSREGTKDDSKIESTVELVSVQDAVPVVKRSLQERMTEGSVLESTPRACCTACCKCCSDVQAPRYPLVCLLNAPAITVARPHCIRVA